MAAWLLRIVLVVISRNLISLEVIWEKRNE